MCLPQIIRSGKTSFLSGRTRAVGLHLQPLDVFAFQALAGSQMPSPLVLPIGSPCSHLARACATQRPGDDAHIHRLQLLVGRNCAVTRGAVCPLTVQCSQGGYSVVLWKQSRGALAVYPGLAQVGNLGSRQPSDKGLSSAELVSAVWGLA